MFSTSGPRPRRGLRRRTRVAVAALATAAVVSGLTASPVASLSPTADCPLPYPVSHVTKGQPVNGLTVTSGTTPESFSGEVLGVIHDGIAPGLDMIMARLTSPEIDRVGIWQGMSGSPVYAQDGTLIGAVAYGLTDGPSPVAGITPAEEMYHLLSDAPQDPAAQSTLRVAAGDQPVAIPERLTARLTTEGVDAGAGMTRLPLPLTISGMASPTRLKLATKAFAIPGVRVHQGGAVSSSEEAIPVVAGGNLAASLSYGDVSTVGVGTATAVCGDQVLAFGHPMSFTGTSQMTMHGADAIYIQEDKLGPGFKVANATAPVGSISKDGLAGLFGVQRADAVPATTAITSDVHGPDGFSRTGTTRISVPDAVPDISAFHLLADEDRGFNGVSGGSATVSWDITGRRADGSPFRLRRTDKYASKQDLSYDTVTDLYDALAKMHFNQSEDVTINHIKTSSDMTRTYQAYDVERVQVWAAGRWRALRTDQPLLLRPGTRKSFLVHLTSKTLPAAQVRVVVPVPENIGMKRGAIRFLGGNASDYSDEAFAFAEEEYLAPETTTLPTFGQVLRRLRHAPRNDDVLAKLTLVRRNGTLQKSSVTSTATAVVNGGVTVPVQGIGFPRFFRR